MKIAMIGSLILSIFHSILFWDKDWGISILLFTVAGIFFLIYILDKLGKIQNKKPMILAVPIILLSSTYFIFNNQLFNTLNILVILVLSAIMIIFMMKENSNVTFILTKIFNIIVGPIEFFGDSLKMIKETIWGSKKEDEKENGKQLKKIGKALLIVIPLVLIVLALLMSADQIFANMFRGIDDFFKMTFSSDFLFSAFFRIGIILVLTLYFISFLYNLTSKESSYNTLEDTKRKREIKIEGLTVNIILTVLNIIYAIFCFIQISYLFTKMTLPEGFTYAEYARQGFFELMIVTFINFAIILISNLNKAQLKQTEVKYTKVMNLLLAVFTIILVFSSFYRMHLYETEFGYTVLRLLVYFILGTELIMMIPTILYIINGKVNLVKAYLAIGVSVYLVINFVNLDHIIAKENIDRYFETGKIDFYYLTKDTGTDAVNQIVRLLENPDVQKVGAYEDITNQVKGYLLGIRNELTLKDANWQEFNISKMQAIQALENLDLSVIYDYNYNYNNDYYNNYNSNSISGYNTNDSSSNR